ncbi:MAG: patatin-like phospholipase family protein [Bacteroidota bacterium]
MVQRLIYTVILLILICLPSAKGQKVGLVLSGGGAKGLAHIGVIQALEENEIPIDYITGTSMGAIIGGLYAAGYTPEQMRNLVLSEEFLRWSTGKIDEKYIYYFKKEPAEASMINLRISFEDSSAVAQLPSNLVPTHQMDLAVLQIFAAQSAEANYHFDSLFVPFRCIATDIYRNKEVVFSKGNLGSAIRASMTFPFYFKPISVNDVLLFDGGMKNNFPWDVLIEDFHPDYIIGSKTADNSPKPSADDIVNQLENMLLSKTSFDLPQNGILIETQFIDVKLLDFEKAPYIITKGYINAMRKMDSIRQLIPVRRSEDELKLRREEYTAKLPALTFDQVLIEGLNDLEREYLLQSIYRKADTFNIEQLQEVYFKLLADGTISSIYPLASYDKESEMFNLYMRVKEENRLITTIGGNISSGPINQGFASVEYNQLGAYARKLKANIYYGRLYSSLMLKARADLPTYYPLSVSGALTLNRWDYYNSSSDPFFEDVRPAYLIKNESNFRLQVRTPLKTNSLLSAEFAFGIGEDKYYQVERFSKSDTSDHTEFRALHYKVGYQKNTLNYRQFPTRGDRWLFQLSHVRGVEEYIPGSTGFQERERGQFQQWFELHAKGVSYLPVNNWYTLGVCGEVNWSNRPFFQNYYATLLNTRAFQPTPHSRTHFLQRYRAHNYAALGVSNIFTLGNSLHFRAESYLFAPYRKIEKQQNFLPAYGEVFPKPTYLLSGSLVYHSIVGPLSLSLNYYDKEDKNLYLIFNFGFILFNQKGLD